MNVRFSLGLLGAVVLSACGPAGTLTGKVTVDVGSAANIAVVVYGPQSAATVTKEDGTFTVDKLPDGVYVAKATLRGADVEEATGNTTITQGKAAGDIALNFKISTAKITGKVVMADGSSPLNLSVTAVGPQTAGARTGSDGSFTFDNMKTGAYLVSVEAPNTKEGRVSIGVFASGPVDAGELRLTPVGRVAGSVAYNMMPAAGVSVTVSGLAISATTDAMGRFSFDDVPAGMQAVTARVGTAPFFRSGTAMVAVVAGPNPDVMVTITDDPPPTGTVSGVVTFHGPRTPRDISISAPGSGVTPINAATNGSYQLTLPVGVWDIVATAPSHPPRTLGRVTVNAGQVQTLPGQELSWWRQLWSSNTKINVGPIQIGGYDASNWGELYFDDGTPRLAVFNSQTLDFRTVAAGSFNDYRVSKLGKYAMWYVANAVFVYEIGTGTTSMYAGSPTSTVGRAEFSTDESTLFIVRNGPTLTRIPLGNPTAQTTWPTTGNATAVQSQNVDRWFVREGTDVRMVLPASAMMPNDIPQVFSGIAAAQQLNVSPTAWALTNCTVGPPQTCNLRVLAPNSTTTVQDMSVNPTPTTFNSFNNLGLDSRGDYPCFQNSQSLPVAAFCVQASNGTHLPLVAMPTQFKLNEAGDRVIFVFPSGANTALREEAMPPLMSTTNLGSNTVGWTTGWISPTRAYAYENSGSPRTLHLVKAGMDVTDADVGNAQPVNVNGPLLTYGQASTQKWRTVLGDNATRAVDISTTFPLVSSAARRLGTGPVTKYGALSFDTTSFWVVDENLGMLKNVIGAYVAGNANRSSGNEFVTLNRVNASQVFYLFPSGNSLEFVENEIQPYAFAGSYAGTLVSIGKSTDGYRVYTGSFAP